VSGKMRRLLMGGLAGIAFPDDANLFQEVIEG
jgi:hypothetical protein